MVGPQAPPPNPNVYDKEPAVTASTNQRCHCGLPRPLAPASVRRNRLVGVLGAVAMSLTLGCGPFGYLKKVAVDASRSVGQAEKAGAKQYAPYEYWGAVTYLEQAKVLMAYSEYDRAFDYGDRAKQLAEEAKKKAARRESGQMRETTADKAKQDEKDSAGKAAGSAAPAAKGTIGGNVGGGR